VGAAEGRNNHKESQPNAGGGGSHHNRSNSGTQKARTQSRFSSWFQDSSPQEPDVDDGRQRHLDRENKQPPPGLANPSESWRRQPFDQSRKDGSSSWPRTSRGNREELELPVLTLDKPGKQKEPRKSRGREREGDKQKKAGSKRVAPPPGFDPAGCLSPLQPPPGFSDNQLVEPPSNPAPPEQTKQDDNTSHLEGPSSQKPEDDVKADLPEPFVAPSQPSAEPPSAEASASPQLSQSPKMKSLKSYLPNVGAAVSFPAIAATLPLGFSPGASSLWEETNGHHQ
jgi:hypothetical protein